MTRHYPLRDEELPEWPQRELEDEEPQVERWSRRQRLAFGLACAVLAWAVLIFAAIGVVAVFGGRP